jgi:hypothetical protein
MTGPGPGPWADPDYHPQLAPPISDAFYRAAGDYCRAENAKAELGDDPVPYVLTPGAEELLEAEAGAEAEWADEWDSADSNAYQARVEAGLEPEAGL